MDQHGTDHRIGGALMQQSGGGALIYTEPDAAVLAAADGQRIDFFSDRQYVSDGLQPAKGTTLSFGLSPSVLVRGKNAGAYRIGLDLSMRKCRSIPVDDLNEVYFLSDDDNTRPALGEMTQGGFRLWLGVVLSVQI